VIALGSWKNALTPHSYGLHARLSKVALWGRGPGALRIDGASWHASRPRRARRLAQAPHCCGGHSPSGFSSVRPSPPLWRACGAARLDCSPAGAASRIELTESGKDSAARFELESRSRVRVRATEPVPLRAGLSADVAGRHPTSGNGLRASTRVPLARGPTRSRTWICRRSANTSAQPRCSYRRGPPRRARLVAAPSRQ
jgi:hypothetical protein